MKVLVVGAGAVGGYYGSRLARGGHDVAFVARGAHGGKIRASGLVLETPDGEEIERVRVLETLEEADGFEGDVVLICVKAKDLATVAKGTLRTLGPRGLAIPLLNGLDSERELAEIIGAERVVGGVAQIAAEIAEPGRLRVRARGRLALAPLQSTQEPSVLRISDSFNEAGIKCRVMPDLASMLWSKMLWNVPFNAICALTGLPAGQIVENPVSEELVKTVMREVCTVARASGVELAERSIDLLLAITRRDFPDTIPSMLQDVRAGRQTEVETLQGAVIRRAEAAGIEVPAIRTLRSLLHAIDDSRAP